MARYVFIDADITCTCNVGRGPYVPELHYDSVNVDVCIKSLLDTVCVEIECDIKCELLSLFSLLSTCKFSTTFVGCCNAVLLVCQGERGPIGPAMVGPRGIPGIPGERGELVSVTRSLLLFP